MARQMVPTIWMWVLMAMMPLGCWGPRVYRVQEDVARETLRRVLNLWQEGAPLEAAQQTSPTVVVQDSDWSAGARLLSYQCLDSGEPRNANLVIRVQLTLQTNDQRPQSKVVTYIVSTSPRLTVFRDPFQ
ncbi:MAG: hypothetical protein KatS3mg114_0241 [Planctomycetaceae bacterium]|nr:MAG: hypothetical protein KatS3mg114_0241 [Planctomycetaceae bacterium]